MRKKRFSAALLATGLFLLAPVANADWSAVKRLTWTSGESRYPAIAVDSGDRIHVVWSDLTPGDAEIYYKRSPDGGTTWNPSQRLTWTSGNSWNPAMAIDSNDAIHVVWHDNTPGSFEIHYKKSVDGGATWSAARRLTWTSEVSYHPTIAVDSNDAIHLVWRDDKSGGAEIYYRKSTDGGATWSDAQRLTWTSGGSFTPAIAAGSGNTIHVVWRDDTPGNPEVFFKKSTNSGNTWSEGQRLTWTSGESYLSAIGADLAGAIHVIWFDDTSGNFEVYFKTSKDGGSTWSANKRITWTSDGSYDPALATDSENEVHFVWNDYTPGNHEVYYRRTGYGGLALGPAGRLTWNSGNSWSPVIALDSIDVIHIVWYDYTPGNSEIYYKKCT